MIIYKMVYLAKQFYGSESWTVWTRCESSVAWAEMRYCRQTGDRIRNSQILGILIEVPVTEMVDRTELRWSGHLIRKDNNTYGEEELRGCGEEENEGRLGRAYMKKWRTCGMRLCLRRTGKRCGSVWFNPMSERVTRD